MPGYRMLEARARSSPVLATRRGGDGSEAEVVPSTPVARDRTERWKARVPSVGSHADAIDAGTARDRNAPTSFGAGAQDGEGVVVDVHAVGPPAVAYGRAHSLFFRREVDARHQQRRDLRDRSVRLAEPCVPESLGQ